MVVHVKYQKPTVPKKPSAADRTISVFGVTPAEQNIVAEPEERGEMGERVPLEEELDTLREKALKVQEWATKSFPRAPEGGSEFRVSYAKPHYYVETVATMPGGKTAYGFHGVIVHESHLYSLVTVLVQAVRAKQKSDAEAADYKANGFGRQ